MAEQVKKESLTTVFKRKMSNNSDVFHFTLGMFAGLMVINTADLIANSAYAMLSFVTYFITKTATNILV